MNVDANAAKIATVNPLPGNAPPEYVNGGQYSVTSNVVGVGMNYRF